MVDLLQGHDLPLHCLALHAVIQFGLLVNLYRILLHRRLVHALVHHGVCALADRLTELIRVQIAAEALADVRLGVSAVAATAVGCAAPQAIVSLLFRLTAAAVSHDVLIQITGRGRRGSGTACHRLRALLVVEHSVCRR